MSTLKRTTMHPRCRHIGACWDLLECWFQLFSTSQNTIKIRFQTFLKKKNQFFFFGSHVVVATREDLSVDVSITNVGLISTKPGRFLFSAYGNSGYGQNSISSILNFLKKFQIFGFPCCSTREDLSKRKVLFHKNKTSKHDPDHDNQDHSALEHDNRPECNNPDNRCNADIIRSPEHGNASSPTRSPICSGSRERTHPDTISRLTIEQTVCNHQIGKQSKYCN